MNTTLNLILAAKPCGLEPGSRRGWQKLLTGLDKTGPDDEPLPLSEILRINGLDDAFWAIRATPGHERPARLLAVDCAREVQYLMTDPRSVAALDVAERYAHGLATEAELATARAAARAAAKATAEAPARATAWAAAWAASTTAEATAEAAARAAEATAEAAARATAWATWATARATTEATVEAARNRQAALFLKHFGDNND